MVKYPVLIYENKEMVLELKEFLIKFLRHQNVQFVCEYILARTFENIFLVSCKPSINPSIEISATSVITNFRRQIENGETVSLTQDVGKLLQKISSTDLPFDCCVELRGTVIVLRQT